MKTISRHRLLLHDKIVLIVGASRGIGAAAAHLFAEEGATVILSARSDDEIKAVAKEIRAQGGVAEALVADLAHEESVMALLAHVEATHGRLDGAFNNGAVTQSAKGPLDSTGGDDIEQQFRVNFRGPWLAMRAEAGLMRAGGGGAIVNTSSIGSLGASPSMPGYAAMKRALNSLTETAAATWGTDAIRVNGIAPGGTSTDMLDDLLEATGVSAEQLAKSIPLGRVAEPREVAQVAAWLLSDMASMVTGAIIPVDGGASA